MATTTVHDPSKPFSRLTEGRTTSSWRLALPIVVLVVAAIAGLAYLASRMTTYSAQAMTAQRDADAARQAADAAVKRASTLEGENNLMRSAGRTTVILEGATIKPKKGAAAASSRDAGWAAATWGETSDGKTWMKVSAHGLKPAAEGKVYRIWLEPKDGPHVEGGKLELTSDGNAFAWLTDLPAVDQGKTVLIAMDESDAKAPGEAVLSATLPTLKPSALSKPSAAAQTAAPATPEAK
jgi:hypothetical protein